MITKSLNQALFAAMFGEATEVIVENVGENLETLTELKTKYPDAIDFKQEGDNITLTKCGDELYLEMVKFNLKVENGIAELNDKGECGPIKSLLKFLSWLFKNVNKKTAEDVMGYVHSVKVSIEEGANIDNEVKAYVENFGSNLKEDLVAALGNVTSAPSYNSVKASLIDNMYELLVKYSNEIFEEVMDNPKANDYTFWDACTRDEAFETLGIEEEDEDVVMKCNLTDITESYADYMCEYLKSSGLLSYYIMTSETSASLLMVDTRIPV